MTRLKPLIAVQAVLFAAASLVHTGTLLSGYEHRRAAIAEDVIALVLFIGLAASLVRSTSTRTITLSEGFALLGRFVGAFTIAVGAGPQWKADYALHVLMLALPASGIVVA